MQLSETNSKSGAVAQSRMLTTAKTLKRSTAIDLAVILFVVLLFYFPVLITCYGHTDDFLLYFSGEDSGQVYLSAGRPLLALMWNLSRGAINQVEDLRWLRLISLLGTIAIAWQTYFLANRITRLRMGKISLGIGVAALPGLTVLVAWATCYLYPLAALFSIWAALLTEASTRSGLHNRRLAISQVLGSFFLLIVAFTIYQPTVSWFWLVALLAVLDRRFIANARHRARTWLMMLFGLIQFVCCVACLKVYFIVSGVQAQSRGELLRDPLEKIRAFAEVQIPLAMNQWHVIDVNRKPLIALICIGVAIVLVAGCFSFVRKIPRVRSAEECRSSHLVAWFTTLFLTIMFSHAHWWALSYTAKNYRGATTLTICVTLLIWWSILQCGDSAIPKSLRKQFLSWTFLLLTLLASFKASQNVNKYWTYPYATSYQYLVDQLKENITPQTKHIHLILQQANEGIVTERNIYSFGRPFTDVEWDWAPPAIMRAALIDVAEGNTEIHDATEYELTSSRGSEQLPASDPAIVVIDMRQVIKYRK